MRPLSRRALLASSATAAAGLFATRARTGAPAAAAAGSRIAMLHVTDLFRPHVDPDDHWDLACVYALAHLGHVDLLGVLVDYPPDGRRDPDVLAVAQLNFLTGLAVPVMIGSPRRVDRAEASRPQHRDALQGVLAMLRILRSADRPVVINVLGSCRDVAIAGGLEPGLFAEKCAAVYLNAGVGSSDPAKAARLEYNVSLDPASYAAIFQLPCPVMWMPCFEEVPASAAAAVSPRGTFYAFRQNEILPRVSERLQNYFAYMYLHGQGPAADRNPTAPLRSNWLQYLLGPRDAALLERQGAVDRNMWCTAGLLHAAGLTVSAQGQIGAHCEVASPVFAWDTVQVRCEADGITHWSPDPKAVNRQLFHVRDTDRYQAAMTAALRDLVSSLP